MFRAWRSVLAIVGVALTPFSVLQAQQPAAGCGTCSGKWVKERHYKNTVNWAPVPPGNGIGATFNGGGGAYTGNGFSITGGQGLLQRSVEGYIKYNVVSWDNGANATPPSSEKCRHDQPKKGRVTVSGAGSASVRVQGETWGKAGDSTTAYGFASLHLTSNVPYANNPDSRVDITANATVTVAAQNKAGTITINLPVGGNVSLDIPRLWNPNRGIASFDKQADKTISASGMKDDDNLIGYEIQAFGKIALSGSKVNKNQGNFSIDVSTVVDSLSLSCSGGEANGCCNGSNGSPHTGHGDKYSPATWIED